MYIYLVDRFYGEISSLYLDMLEKLNEDYPKNVVYTCILSRFKEDKTGCVQLLQDKDEWPSDRVPHEMHYGGWGSSDKVIHFLIGYSTLKERI